MTLRYLLIFVGCLSFIACKKKAQFLLEEKTTLGLDILFSCKDCPKHSPLHIKMLEVREDSRCPTGTNCVWAGQATIALLINGQEVEWSVPGVQHKKTTYIAAGYEIDFIKLSPYPETRKKILPESYSLEIVTRIAAPAPSTSTL